jgi:hypothetical protein
VVVSNRERVGRAIELLGVALGRYVDLRMTQRSPVGGNWKAAYAGENVDSDASTLIGVVFDNWPIVFRDELRAFGRSLLTESRTWRNDWAHTRTFSDSDTDRALDTVERLLTLIGAPESAEVGALKEKSPPADDEREDQPVIPQLPMRIEGPRAPVPDGGLHGRRTNAWLILSAARALTSAGQTPFARIDVYRSIWERHPRSEHGRPALDPTFQGMVSNAPGGPPSAVGEPLLRVDRGLYVLADPSRNGVGNELSDPSGGDSNEAASSADDGSRSLNRSSASRRPRQEEVRNRIDSLIGDFDQCVETYDRSAPFNRTGQYEFHRQTIDRRTAVGSVEAAVHDVEFLELLYKTLQRWGIGIRASVLVPFPEFRSTLESHLAQLGELEPLAIESLTENVQSTIAAIDFLISDLHVVDNWARIVAGTKTLHHLLPNLVPPMDRAWTGAFFGWSTIDPQNKQTEILNEAFSAFVEIAGETHPSRLVGAGWRTSSTKVLDNALIGYCKIHGLGRATGGAPPVQ